jgi:hypothetical protein
MTFRPFKETFMSRRKLAGLVLATGALFTTAAQAHGDLSALSALSVLPVASVAVGASMAAGAVVALPVALSATGTVLVVKSVEVGARASVVTLERASDGALVSVEVLHHGAHHAALSVGTGVTVSVLASGVVLSALGEAVAFIPNALGRALLYNERVAY